MSFLSSVIPSLTPPPTLSCSALHPSMSHSPPLPKWGSFYRGRQPFTSCILPLTRERRWRSRRPPTHVCFPRSDVSSQLRPLVGIRTPARATGSQVHPGWRKNLRASSLNDMVWIIRVRLRFTKQRTESGWGERYKLNRALNTVKYIMKCICGRARGRENPPQQKAKNANVSANVFCLIIIRPACWNTGQYGWWLICEHPHTHTHTRTNIIVKCNSRWIQGLWCSCFSRTALFSSLHLCVWGEERADVERSWQLRLIELFALLPGEKERRKKKKKHTHTRTRQAMCVRV